MRASDREPIALWPALLGLFFLLLQAPLSGADLDGSDLELEEALELPSLWVRSVEARLWTGFKDNVLLANRDEEESPLIAGGADFGLFRLPMDGWEWFFLSSADYTRYPNAAAAKEESSAIAQGQGQKEFGDGWKAGGSAEYIYFNQVFDASILQDERRAIKLEAHGFTVRPMISKALRETFRLELELPSTRQFFGDIIDDYWETGAELTLGREFTRATDLAASYEFLDRFHDSRESRDSAGRLQPGRILQFRQHELTLAWRQFWDPDRRWRTVTRLSLQLNEDNGGGYYDYLRPEFSEQIRYESKSWAARAEVRVAHYLYAHQRVSDSDSPIRERTYVRLNLRGEKNLWKTLKLFAQYEYERALSNLETDTYTANTISAGLDWEY